MIRQGARTYWNGVGRMCKVRREERSDNPLLILSESGKQCESDHSGNAKEHRHVSDSSPSPASMHDSLSNEKRSANRDDREVEYVSLTELNDGIAGKIHE